MIECYKDYKEFVQIILKDFLVFHQGDLPEYIDYPEEIMNEQSTLEYYNYCFDGDINEVQ